MKRKSNFKCTSDGLEEIPKEVIKLTGSVFPEIHTNTDEMVKLSKAIKKYKKDTICKLPFCATVEAEAMGADIKLGDKKNGPRVNNYVFNRVEELITIKEIDLCKGRIKQILDSVKNLSHQNEMVSLNVEGPFTIIFSLIEPGIFYRGIKNNKEIIDQFMHIIEDNILRYTLAGIKNGAKIISFADPAGAMDIVGPRLYKDLSGKMSYNLLKKLQNKTETSIIHLCGKTSTAFEQLGFSQSEPVKYDESLTYGEAICFLSKNNEAIKMIGHSCIKKTPFKPKKSDLWWIKLN